MSSITAVKPNPKNDTQGFAVFDDGTEAWTPERTKVEPLIGKPLPDGWTLKDGPYGKQLLPPKEGKGGAGGGFRNSKEGQLYEQERMDRRTALMQAVIVSDGTREWGTFDFFEIADHLYEWLRKTSGVATSPAAHQGSTRTAAAPEPTSPAPVGGRRTEPDLSGTKAGEGDAPESVATTSAPAAGDSSAVSRAADTGQVGEKTTLAYGEGVSGSTPTCPPHLLDYEAVPTKSGRLPCKKCRAWVKDAGT